MTPNHRGTLQRDVMRELADAIPQALWISERGTLCYVNPSCRNLTGLPPAPNQPAAKLCDALDPQDRPILLDHISQPGDAEFECRLLRPDGNTLWVRIRTFAIAVLPGRPLCAGMMEDITAARLEISKVERHVTAVSTVSHELRTPLTSIAGSLALISGNPAWELPAAARRLLAIAHVNSERLVRLVNDLLDIEKIESGGPAFDLTRLSVNALVAQAIDANRGFAETFDVRIRLTAASDCEVDVDPDRFVQVMTNLLSNAVKFSPAGEEVEVAIAPQPAKVSIAIRDHGPGIPEEFKPRVFERFARAETSGPRHKSGSGLGLSIANEIVARLGGTLSFDDAPGGGTLFRVVLPISTAAKQGADGADQKDVA
ncbi:MAG: PAS domain-containing sensor histidine kinase [Methylovirgula sp.]